MRDFVTICYLVSLFIICLGGIITFDCLVQLQRRSHAQEWERDGKPWHGFGVGGGAAWKQCSLTWLFSTAPWMREDRAAFRLLMAYRGLCVAFNLVLFGGLICGVL